MTVVPWHHDKTRKCLDCIENGAPFDGGCRFCGYADRRWCKPRPEDPEGLWDPTALASAEGGA